MPSVRGASNNPNADPRRMERGLQALSADGARGRAGSIRSDREVVRAIQGLNSELTPDAEAPFVRNAVDPVRRRKAIAALRRAT